MMRETLLFFDGATESLSIYLELEQKLIAAYPNMIIKVQKTQISFYHGCGFSCASLPRKGRGLLVTFGLPFKIQSDRLFAATEPYPGRWTHYVIVEGVSDVDKELLSWMDMAHEFALNKRKRNRL